MKQKLLAFLLILAMLLVVGCSAAPTKEAPAEQPAAEEPVAEEPAAEEPAAEEPAAEEPAAEEPVEEPAEEPEIEPSGEVTILFTSDVHCGIDQGFGYAGLQQVRDGFIAKGDAVILVDDGDSIQGEPVGTMTKGEALVDLMNQAGYEIAIPGNHEFDYGMDQFLALAEKAEYEYISCNFNHNGDLVLKPYVIKELAGHKIAFVGVTTPKTLTTSTPTYFMDEEGNFVYGFFQDETGEGVFNAVQTAVDTARAEGAEYVIVMGHMGNEETCRPWTYADVIENTTGIDVFLDGHSHDTEQVVVKNKDGEDVIRSACGTKLGCIGWCHIDTEGKLTAGVYTWNNKISAPALLGIENSMSDAVANATVTLNEKLSEVVASTQVNLVTKDPVAVDANGKAIRIIRSQETNLGDLCADAYRAQTGAQIAIVNGGGIRADINAGDITLNDILQVHPFGNEMCMIEVTGQQILDALEWSCRNVPGEVGGFLQVSGISYEIHSYIESGCLTNEDGMFVGVEGERRVKNVLVNGEPIDPEATYTLAGTDYILMKKGDGYAMFADSTVLLEKVKLDNQVLIDYITENLNGVVGEEYDNPYGQGRIVIVEEAPEA